MNDRELMFLPAHRQRQMIVDGEISSVEMTEASLRRIAELEPQLHAFITLDQEGALSSARQADERLAAGDEAGVLHGVPLVVKDLEVTEGLRTTLGSTFFKDWVPDYDSVVVERLRATGAVILGKTNTPEFGNREETFSNVAPTCNNPWDTARMPGGSSGERRQLSHRACARLAPARMAAGRSGCRLRSVGSTVTSRHMDGFHALAARLNRPTTRPGPAAPCPTTSATRRF